MYEATLHHVFTVGHVFTGATTSKAKVLPRRSAWPNAETFSLEDVRRPRTHENVSEDFPAE